MKKLLLFTIASLFAFGLTLSTASAQVAAKTGDKPTVATKKDGKASVKSDKEVSSDTKVAGKGTKATPKKEKPIKKKKSKKAKNSTR